MRAVQSTLAKERLVALNHSTDLVQFVTIRMKESKLCKHCGLTLHLRDREGDICLQCLASLRPHTTYHENTFGYSTIEGCIRQSLDIPLTDKEKDDETK